MVFELNTMLKRSCVVALFPVLTACASLVPGMKMVPTAPVSASEQARVQPIFQRITPGLLESLQTAKTAQPDADLSVFLKKPSTYLIGKGDLLSILVWDHPELSIATTAAQALSASGAQTPSGFLVDQEGRIQFPYVGPIKVTGLTEIQARQLLMKRLVKSIKNPDITLRVQNYRSKRVYVSGDVDKPGNLNIDDVPMTLTEALTRGGGMLPTADQSNITVTRKGVTYPVNIPQMLKRGVDPSRFLLADGDVVRVASRNENKVFVLGEVIRPQALPMHDGRLTLTQALGEAGGLNPASAAAQLVYVIRNATAEQPLIFNLNADSPISLALAENFELDPRDVVYVDASRLARFNRVISLILPTAASLITSYDVGVIK